MEHLVFGHGGAPVLVFPTSSGRFYQWEDFGMMEPLAEHLRKGWLQLFCVDSIDQESWYNFDIWQWEQLERHRQYEHYLLEEFLPELRRYNQNPYLILTGASFGAFHAVSFGFRFPQVAGRVVAMSGDYECRKYVEEYEDEEVYFHSPIEFMQGMEDPELLDEFRRLDIVLATGRHDFCLGPTEALSRVLHHRGIQHRCHVWDDPGVHDWPLWRRQVIAYL